MTSDKTNKGIIRVVQRELHRIVRKPRYFIILSLAVIFAFTFFATAMNEGIPEKLPIGVVDMDNSYLSRRLCHEINASQGVKVVAVYNNHTEARKAMQKGKIFAFYEIPKGTYNEVLNFQAPHFGLYSNTSYLLAGTLSYKQLATMGMLAAGAVQRELLRKKGYDEKQIMGLIQPIEVDTHPIGNPWTSYQIYLMTTLIPAIIAFIVLLFTVYLIGREQEESTLDNLMKRANMNATKAIVGKLFPYWAWFTLLLLTVNLIMFSVMHFPLKGSWLLMVLNSMLLIFAAQCAGVFIAGCIPEPPFAMGVTAVYGAMSFSISGFSFPVENMPRAFSGISCLYPIRHYYLNYRNIAIHGNGIEHCWPMFCALIAFAILALIGIYRFQLNYKRGILTPTKSTL